MRLSIPLMPPLLSIARRATREDYRDNAILAANDASGFSVQAAAISLSELVNPGSGAGQGKPPWRGRGLGL